MQILATGRRARLRVPPDSQRGFTLVELLVTLLVIALLGSVVALSVDSGSAEHQREMAHRMFLALAEEAREEAELTGVDHGLTVLPVVDDYGDIRFEYQWWRRYQEPLYEFFATPGENPATGAPDRRRRETVPEWETDNDMLYKPRTLPRDLEVFLAVNDVPVDFRRMKAPENPEDIQPLIVFFASGEVTPSVFEMREAKTEESLWRYDWDLLGQLQIEVRGELLDDSN